MYITQADLVRWRLQFGAENQESAIIRHMIETWEKSDEFKAMGDGIKYYKFKHKINDRAITYFDGQTYKENFQAPNHKLKHPFHRNAVDQKVDKTVGDQPTIESTNPEQDLTEYVDTLKMLMGGPKKWHKKIQKWAKGASNKGLEWSHLFVDPEGKLWWIITPAQWIIPVYDTAHEEKLVAVVRYYDVVEIDQHNEEKRRRRVEWWDDNQVIYYLETAEGRYMREAGRDPDPENGDPGFENPAPHYRLIDGSAGSWGEPPFVDLKNNDDLSTDLEPVKPLIDGYDLANSDFMNDLSAIQQVIWKLKGYDGTDLKEFMNDLLVFKAIRLDANGDATAETVDIPKEARETMLDRLERDIHLFGRSVNTRGDMVGGNPSGVALKFLFAFLEIKSKDLKSNMDMALARLWALMDKYIAVVGDITAGENWAADNLKITYNEWLIINEAERVDGISKSVGIIDHETLVAAHPYAKGKDPAEVVEAVNKEQKPAPLTSFDDEV